MTYARIYYAVMDDPKFDGIREDVRLFGAWALLLLHAEMAWPTAPYIPPPVPRPVLARLVEAGLVDMIGADRYRIHGLDGERERRSLHARAASQHRWGTPRSNAPSNAGGNAQSMPRRDETRRDEVSAKPKRCPEDAEHALLQADGNVHCLVCQRIVA